MLHLKKSGLGEVNGFAQAHTATWGRSQALNSDIVSESYNHSSVMPSPITSKWEDFKLVSKAPTKSMVLKLQPASTSPKEGLLESRQLVAPPEFLIQ